MPLLHYFVIGRPRHVISPLQKRMMTKQVAVIASCVVRSRKQSREPDSVRINDFVIISTGHGKPLQKRVMTIQVAVIATARWLLSEAMH